MFQQDTAPVAGSLLLSALVALLPLLTIFVMLGVFKAQAYVTALSSLVVSLLVAIVAFKMPVKLALLSGTEGAVFGLIPVVWIVLNAVWLYQLTVVTGRADDLRASFGLVSDDPRVQAIIIAFCFGALMEALAGFGAPVAITGMMLMAVGFTPMRAAIVVLLANTAPVAFGAVGAPIIASAGATNIPVDTLYKIVGAQCSVLPIFVPLLLVLVVGGWRGVRQTWPVALVTGVSFAAAQYWAANYGQGPLTDVYASLIALVATVVFLRFWQPKDTQAALDSLRAEHERELVGVSGSVGAGAAGGASHGAASGSGGGVATAGGPDKSGASTLSKGRIVMAFAPYLIVTVVFYLTKKSQPLVDWLTMHGQKGYKWPGLGGHVLGTTHKPVSFTTYNFQWLNTPGSFLVISALIVMLVYRISPAKAIKEYGVVLNRLKFTILTISSLLALAYVMNISGQTLSIGKWIAAIGTSFAFVSPLLGWVGVYLTGSDTSAAALFGSLQQNVGHSIGVNPNLLVAANNSGGVLGKMISPQNLAIAATATGLAGQESAIFRKVLPWSMGMLAFMCIYVGLMSTPVLSWLVR